MYSAPSRFELATLRLIPIRDILPRTRLPLVNWALLALTAAVFFYQLSLGRQVVEFVAYFGFVPATAHAALDGADPSLVLLSLLTSPFLHGGWFHVAGNLLYLRVFGDNIEDRLGHLGFLVFYLASAAAGAAGHYWSDPTSPTPMIGASGAIAGVLGAYLVLFPRARVVTLFPVVIVLTALEVPAFVFLGVWALQQLLNGYAALGAGTTDVAWFAHLGGFVFGSAVGLVARLIRKK